MTADAINPQIVRFSIVIPVFNEEDNVEVLLDEVRMALDGLGVAEVIFVDDGSTDNTVERLRPLLRTGPFTVRLVRHLSRSGQSAAVQTGVRVAHGAWIGTLDGDGQNDPRDLPGLLAFAESSATSAPALVAGVRARRQDNLSKRLASRLANGIRQALLADGAVDTGCGIKVFQRQAFLCLPFFGAMHRFLPALFQIHGYGVAYLPVNHRPRQRGQSKYVNWRRGAVGVLDLLGVLWLKCRTPVLPPIEEG